MYTEVVRRVNTHEQEEVVSLYTIDPRFGIYGTLDAVIVHHTDMHKMFFTCWNGQKWIEQYVYLDGKAHEAWEYRLAY